MKRVKKIYAIIKPYIPFIVLFVVCLLMHRGLYYMNDDPINANNIYNRDQLEYLIGCYNKWSSRIFIYLVNNIFYMLPMFFWKIVDSVVIVVGAICISRIFNQKRDIILDCFISLLVLLFPFFTMSSAGFIATTLSYYWPIVFLLICMLPVKKIFNKEVTKPYVYPIYFILLLYATDCEQIAVFLLILSICFIIYQKVIKKEKLNWYLISLLILAVLKIVFIKTCPGNTLRSISEASVRFPLYNTLSLIDKIYMGFLYTTKVNIENGIPIFVLTLFLCILTNVLNKNTINIIFSNLLLVMVSLMTILNSVTQNYFPFLAKYINGFSVTISSSFYVFDIISLIMSLFLYVGLLYLLIINLKNDKLTILLYLGGLLTQFIMIFSPTIYASGSRTGSVMFYTMLIVSILVLKKLYPLLNNKKINFLITFITLLTIMCVIKFIEAY